MHIKNVFEILQKATDGKVTQNDIACAIGTSRANVSKLMSKNSILNSDKIEKIEKYFNLKLDFVDGYISVDYYPDSVAIVENDKLEWSKKCVKFNVPTTFFEADSQKRYIMCHAMDNSMYPLIWPNDIVIIEQNSSKSIVNGKIYAFIFDGIFYIKRLTKNISQFLVTSENKKYPDQYIEQDISEKLYILGNVVYVGKTASQL